MIYPGFFITELGGDAIEELFEVNFSAERL